MGDTFGEKAQENLDRGIQISSAAQSLEHMQNATEQSALSAFVEHAWDATKYDLIQAPVNGVTQLVDYITHTNHLQSVQMFEQPKQAEFGSAAWAADMVGGVVATGLQFAFLHKLVGPGAASDLERSASYGLGQAALPSIRKSVLTGLVMGGVFTPVSNQDQNSDFFTARFRNAFINGVTFGTLTAGSIGLKSTGSAFLANDLVASGLSGIPAGIIDCDGRSLLTHGHLAGWNERFQTVTNFSVGGMIAGGTNIIHEEISPTSGIKGVRTPEDMKALADTTVQPGHPERYEYDENRHRPPKADYLIARNQQGSWLDRSVVDIRTAIDESTMPLANRKMIVAGHQQLATSLEALSNRPDPQPIITVYGSARFKPGDFRYERARYIGGRAAQGKFDVMTGGGPGTMEAANRGAYEANGTSIGVIIKLPFENGDQGNGYQNLTLYHRDFYTRMQVLKTVGEGGAIIVEEGGLGTLAEAADTLTHIQTKKMDGVPVYFVGKKTWQPFEQILEMMEQNGTISPKDRKLYRIVDNPDDIFDDLRQRRTTGQSSDSGTTAPVTTSQPATELTPTITTNRWSRMASTIMPDFITRLF